MIRLLNILLNLKYILAFLYTIPRDTADIAISCKLYHKGQYVTVSYVSIVHHQTLICMSSSLINLVSEKYKQFVCTNCQMQTLEVQEEMLHKVKPLKDHHEVPALWPYSQF